MIVEPCLGKITMFRRSPPGFSPGRCYSTSALAPTSSACGLFSSVWVAAVNPNLVTKPYTYRPAHLGPSVWRGEPWFTVGVRVCGLEPSRLVPSSPTPPSLCVPLHPSVFHACVGLLLPLHVLCWLSLVCITLVVAAAPLFSAPHADVDQTVHVVWWLLFHRRRWRA